MKRDFMGYEGDLKVSQRQSGVEAERAFLLRSIHAETINKNSNQICKLLESTRCQSSKSSQRPRSSAFPFADTESKPGEIKQPRTLLGLTEYWSPWKGDCFVDTTLVNPVTSLGTAREERVTEQRCGVDPLDYSDFERTRFPQFYSIQLPICKTIGKGVLYERWGVRRDLSLQLAASIHFCFLPICSTYCSQVTFNAIKFTHFQCKI